MNQSHSNETNANKALEQLIKRVMHGRNARAEHTSIIKNHADMKPDLTITAQGRSPVIIEAKWMHVPENKVQEQADWYVREKREVNRQSHPVEAAIALRYPDEFAQADDIDKELEKTRELRYCAVYPNGKRFPTTGWLKGSVSDLADLIHLVDVPETAFDKCAEDLEKSIDEAVSHFPDEVKVVNKIFQQLGLTEDPKAKDLSELQRRKLKRTQTGRIAGAILANALLFHERIAAAYTHKRIPTISETGGRFAENRKSKALAAWKKILAINYWPIFDAGSEIIRILPARQASEVLRILTAAAERIHEQGLLYENDLTGHVFQKLIVDRKYLAAFYTLPTSAALLARLAVSKMKVDWRKDDKIRELKIADFACGTGALLSAVYDQIANRYERTGGNPADLHQALMEQVLYGFDVVHYATCLTASVLSGKQPGKTYDDTWFCTMPYGRQKDETVKIGSLEFLDQAEQRILFHTGDPAKSPSGKGEDRRRVEVLDNSMDLVIMNPPFRRTATREGKDDSARGPFAAYGASEEDQKRMSKRMSQMTKDTCYGLGAGIASAFAAVANKKLKPDGILALVLPMTTAMGSSWKKFRTILAKEYTDVEVVSLADAKCYEVAFSAFTSMADCLVIARKKSASLSSQDSTATRFVSLIQRPTKLAASGEIAKELEAKGTKRKLEDGPFGGTDIDCGHEKMGETILANVDKISPAWNPVRIQDFELIQTAYQLTQSKLHLPRRKEESLAIAPLFKVGTHRPHHRIIIGPSDTAPFYQTKSLPKPTDTYPALWNHEAKREHYLICQPDRKLKAVKGQEERANALWHHIAGRCHITQDHTLTSQPLSVSFTERDCIGGTAWPNVNFAKKNWDYAFSLWGNSTLGLLLFWWHGNRQQPGRARITVTTLRTLPVLDFRALSDTQIQQAKTIFNQFKGKRFAPAYVADEDSTRDDLDRAVLCDWLDFSDDIYYAVRGLAKKWCAEPSVHGGKQRK